MFRCFNEKEGHRGFGTFGKEAWLTGLTLSLLPRIGNGPCWSGAREVSGVITAHFLLTGVANLQQLFSLASPVKYCLACVQAICLLKIE